MTENTGRPTGDQGDIPAHFFQRADETPDEVFYRSPRFVTHIDPETIAALTDFYREFIPPHADVLDLMSSWISHFPEALTMGRVAGLGMNREELAANPQLTEYCIHNLNETPVLPYDAGSFSRVTLAVSIQYLTRPVDVMRSVYEVLQPEGALCIAMSHRLFPTKAIAAFQHLPAQERIRLAAYYLQQAGFTDTSFIDRSPQGADPLWLVIGKR